MNTYKTGSYIIKGQKNWICESCEKIIIAKFNYFGRAKNISPKLTTWKRFHLNCALQLADLNNYEKQIINNSKEKNPNGKWAYKYNSSETYLRININKNLKKYEDQKKLVYLGVTVGMFKNINSNTNKIYRMGRKGFADFVVFLKNQQTLFLELKCEKKKYLNPYQKEFKAQVEQLGYQYYIISSPQELHNIIHKYI